MGEQVTCTQARADSIAQCDSAMMCTLECDFTQPQALAISVAFAEAHAAATAEAFASYCTCSNAEAWGFDSTNMVLEILSFAEFEALAVPCASGVPIPAPVSLASLTEAKMEAL